MDVLLSSGLSVFVWLVVASVMRLALPVSIFLLLTLSSLGVHARVDPDPTVPPSRKLERHYIAGTSLTEDTLSLARMLKIDKTIEELKSAIKNAGDSPNQEQLVRIMFLRQNCERAIQFASLELEEALANIDGDLADTDLEYSLFSAKYERSVILNNAATFLTSGTLGVLDSATGIKYGAPTPNVFGITGNAAAVAIPLWGLRPRKYKPLRSESSGNMLTPIFGLPYDGVGYDPIIWQYLNAVALDEKDQITRRQALLDRWKKFRRLSRDGQKNETEVKRLAGIFEKGDKVTLDLLKTRRELLTELRAEVQSMYADLSDLNTEIIKY